MIKTSHFSALLAITCMVFSASAAAQACEGGAYLNPQLFSGESAVQRSRVEQEMRTFMNTTGLSAAAMYSVKQVDEVTSPGRAPYCWIYANQVMGLLSGYKLVFVPFAGGKPAGPPRDILGGFLAPDESVSYGRPVGVVLAPGGGLLMADDVGDVVWRVVG